ncbi:hypothetical protein F4556_001360 [Kitasatospora gansuensis]|uniref:Uncharacterized protein n=1 Tax=Kitasatospora gansuensis TaxID=258050 RepID=A0A7W7WGN9_9ACTN|nr:hypothetical protein [Kitasatospora gansuensis]MBB4945825.1 hypothetical protein [Kitasatospora gansuensis]
MSDGAQGSNGWARPDGGEPDWAALAEQHEQQYRRRKKLRMIGAVAGSAVLVGVITVTAVALSGPAKDTKANQAPTQAPTNAPTADQAGTTSTEPPGSSPFPTTSASASPSPSASGSVKPSAAGTSRTPSASGAPATPVPGSTAPLDPLTVISAAATDTAPLDPGSLFPATTLSIDGKTWTRLTTGANPTCWQTTTGGLGDVITAQGCRTVLRATYTSGSSAVTIGVAVFDARANADASNQAHKGQVQGLVAAGQTSFCTSAGCVNTHGAVGRYTYYTVSGTVKPGGNTADPVATAAGPDFAAHARAQLLARGSR